MQSKNLSRAEMIARMGMAPIAIGAFAALSSEALAADNKAQFKYQTHPKGKQMCSNCALFVAPNKCKVVTGVISPKGWCISYAAKQ